MPGLLDAFLSGQYSPDPDKNEAIRQGLLSTGLGLLNSRGGFGQALGQAGQGGLAVYNRSREEAQQAAMRKLAMEQQQQQMADEARRRDFLKNMPSPQMAASQAALGGGGGPTVANAAQMPQVDPMQQLMFQGAQAGAVPLQAYLASMQKEDPLMTVAPGASVYNKKTGKVAYTSPKETTDPDDVRKYLFSVNQGYRGTFDEWDIARRKASAPSTSVSVNTGQKGYENESRLRNDFKAEPIYKDFADMKSAHAQIKASIAQGTPIADTAAATKIMKLLDPGSVVRESELGVAMAAAGKMDRLTNYVQMQVSGAKLTPQQRKDFGALADELMNAATQAYNSKRSEYEKFGKGYGLNPEVLGPPGTTSERVINWADHK